MPRNRQVEQDLHLAWAWSLTKPTGAYADDQGPGGDPVLFVQDAYDPAESAAENPRLFRIFAKLLNISREERVQTEPDDLPGTYAPDEDAKKGGGL